MNLTAGEKGFVLEGEVPFEISELDLGKIPKLRTKIMMNLANPETAFEARYGWMDG